MSSALPGASYCKPGLPETVLEDFLKKIKKIIQVKCAKLLLYSIDLHILNLIKLKNIKIYDHRYI